MSVFSLGRTTSTERLGVIHHAITDSGVKSTPTDPANLVGTKYRITFFVVVKYGFVSNQGYDSDQAYKIKGLVLSFDFAQCRPTTVFTAALIAKISLQITSPLTAAHNNNFKN